MSTKTTKTVTCPKCGREGRESVWRFKAKGHIYYYRVVVHADGRKCILGRAEPPKPAKTDEEVVRKLEALERENEELRKRLQELEKEKAEAEARAQLARSVFAAALVLDRQKLEALRAVYVAKRGYTDTQRETAKKVMHTIVDRGLEAGHAVVCFPEPQHLSLLP